MKKKCLEHQTLGRWVVCPSDPAYYFEDWLIFNLMSLVPLYLANTLSPQHLCPPGILSLLEYLTSAHSHPSKIWHNLPHEQFQILTKFKFFWLWSEFVRYFNFRLGTYSNLNSLTKIIDRANIFLKSTLPENVINKSCFSKCDISRRN